MTTPQNTSGPTLSGIVLGTPDPQSLASFYERLLGYTRSQDGPEWVKIEPPGGGPGLSFQLERYHVAPVWPAGPKDQQMQVHLDIAVADLEEAGRQAEEAGATLADYQPQDDVRVLIDPDGHPFCLFVAG
jgi:catechol 2,3-dioxygenase-like lactoylglutathione lyase family enzyme